MISFFVLDVSYILNSYSHLGACIDFTGLWILCADLSAGFKCGMYISSAFVISFFVRECL